MPVDNNSDKMAADIYLSIYLLYILTATTTILLLLFIIGRPTIILLLLFNILFFGYVVVCLDTLFGYGLSYYYIY
jgi:hypothetical protein